MISRSSAAALAAIMLMAAPLPAAAQSNNSTAHGNANAPGSLMTTCPTQQNGHKTDTQGSAGSTSGSGAPAPQANQTARSSTGINGQTTCPDGTIPPNGTTSANGGPGA